MTSRVCLSAYTLDYPRGGGHFWVYLNWALGLQSLGYELVWLEAVDDRRTVPENRRLVAQLKSRLRRAGLDENVAVWSRGDHGRAVSLGDDVLDITDAAECELLISLNYETPADVLSRFRRTCLIDMDPGLLQVCVAQGQLALPRYDVYFTVGESVDRSPALPETGLTWQHVPPAVAVQQWPVTTTPPDASFSTVSHWYVDEWVVQGDEFYRNDKLSGFSPFLDLPSHTSQRLELAIYLDGDEKERAGLVDRGWSVREAMDVTSTPWEYRRYVQNSKGEFSCAKPAYVRLQTTWLSDRTVCYLASGKPAVVQYTGPSEILPEREGLLRFRTLDEAASCLEVASSDYQRHSQLARQLAEEHFHAGKVATRVLERLLG